jgi:hypothetical protein
MSDSTTDQYAAALRLDGWASGWFGWLAPCWPTVGSRGSGVCLCFGVSYTWESGRSAKAVVLAVLSLDWAFFSPLLTDTISLFPCFFSAAGLGCGGRGRGGGSIILIMMIMNEDLD